eukprot:TRINITY_DN3557_c0_g1_i1.p1 TRINITY_DN3557_c0_g1~~TRINITY_DN3557_c0_g1_i1.p1  ORF type:complete len:166 (-),score=48.21 TRINITY_DN3557_c0_g1_i1:58-555(-)
MDGIALLEYFLWGVVVVLISLIARRMFSSAPTPVVASKPAPEVKREPIHISTSELAKFDGKDPSLPLYIAVKGKIYDMSRGRSFYGPGGPYAVFAGREAARALGKMSTNVADVENCKIDDLDADEKNTLEEWISKFEAKYGVVGFVTDGMYAHPPGTSGDSKKQD